MQNEKIKKAVVIFISILAVFLVLFHFFDTPVPWVDEGIFTEVARNIETHGVVGMQISPGQFYSMRNFTLTASYPLLFPVAASIKIFGLGIWQARLPMVIYMFGFLLVSFLFTKKHYGFYPAAISTLLILSFSPFYGNGRPVQGEVPGLFFMILGLYFILFWEENNFDSDLYAILAGIALGLSAATKPIYMVGILASLGITAFVRQKIIFKKSSRAFIVSMFLPIIGWFLIHTPTLKSFLGFIPSFLFFSSNHDNGPAISIGHVILRNSLRFVTETTPILFLFLTSSVIFAVFLIWRKKINRHVFVSEIILFCFIILNWIGYIPGTGWYRYFFPANLMVYLFFPIAFLSIAKWTNKPVFKNLAVGIMTGLILIQFVHLIFWSDTNFVTHRTRSAALFSALSKIPQNKKVAFFQAPEAIIFLPHNNYEQFTGMGSIYEVGNKMLLSSTSADFVLAKGIWPEKECYQKETVEKYSLFTKISNCKE